MMFRLRRPKRPVVHSRHGWPNRSWHIPALMGAVCLLLAASLALGVMELGTGGSAASIQEAASVESAQGEEESETEAGVSQAALREEAALSAVSSAVESVPEESSQGAVDFAVSYCEEPQPITEEEAAATLESLRDTFPEGAYWNHVGVEDWDEFTVTDSPCQHDLYWDAYCNTYTGGIQELFPQFEPMEQCLNFTFHNVSINTEENPLSGLRRLLPLHSTMFLLIQGTDGARKMIKHLYIPQCFY